MADPVDRVAVDQHRLGRDARDYATSLADSRDRYTPLRCRDMQEVVEGLLRPT